MLWTYESVYGESSPNKFWSKQFKWVRTSIDDDPRSGGPVEATSSEMPQKVETLILQDRRIKIATISKDLNISEPSVLKIIHEHLLMYKFIKCVQDGFPECWPLFTNNHGWKLPMKI